MLRCLVALLACAVLLTGSSSSIILLDDSGGGGTHSAASDSRLLTHGPGLTLATSGSWVCSSPRSAAEPMTNCVLPGTCCSSSLR
jgi:hypothetical protein